MPFFHRSLQLYSSILHEIAQEEKDENIFYCLIINKIQIQYGTEIQAFKNVKNLQRNVWKSG